MDVDELHRDAETRQRVRKQRHRAAIQRLRRDDRVAGLRQVEDGERLRRLPAGRCHRGHAAFQRGHPTLEDVGGGVHDARVDVAELAQGKEVGGVLGVVEDVRRGGVDRHGARVGGGVGPLLGGVDGAGAESEEGRRGDGIVGGE